MSLTRKKTTGGLMVIAIVAFVASGFYPDSRKVYLLIGFVSAAIGLLLMIKDWRGVIIALLIIALIAAIIYTGYPNLFVF